MERPCLTEPVAANEIAVSKKKTIYPDAFAPVVEGREKRKLGDAFGLTNFGVNLTHLQPGAASALLHAHSRQDEFIYILAGHPTLVIGDREFEMSPGQCAGFKAGAGTAHQLVNRTESPVSYLEVGDRSPEDRVHYPQVDLVAVMNTNGQWEFRHKDGEPY
jgi:uncharacterized cupin superfamily protein